jgi:uncharacterized protein with WD repeat
MKKIGLVADNYKVQMFEETLKKEGFKNFMIAPFSSESKIIQVLVPDETFEAATLKIGKICKRIELHFKRSN